MRKEFFNKCVVAGIKPNWGKRKAALTPEQTAEFERRKFGPLYSQPLSAEQFVSNPRELGQEALQRGFDFFSFGYADATHNCPSD